MPRWTLMRPLILVPTIVRNALTETNTIETLISRLRGKLHCLTAASALVSLMAIGRSTELTDQICPNVVVDHVAETVIKSEAPVYIRNMFKRRWFDGHNGEDGVSVLQRVLSIGKL